MSRQFGNLRIWRLPKHIEAASESAGVTIDLQRPLQFPHTETSTEEIHVICIYLKRFTTKTFPIETSTQILKNSVRIKKKAIGNA
jgi:hypothetical protein